MELQEFCILVRHVFLELTTWILKVQIARISFRSSFLGPQVLSLSCAVRSAGIELAWTESEGTKKFSALTTSPSEALFMQLWKHFGTSSLTSCSWSDSAHPDTAHWFIDKNNIRRIKNQSWKLVSYLNRRWWWDPSDSNVEFLPDTEAYIQH